MINTARLKELTEMASQIGEAMGILKSNPSEIHLQRPGFQLRYSTDAMSTKQDLPFSNRMAGLHEAVRNVIDLHYQAAMNSVAKEIAELCATEKASDQA